MTAPELERALYRSFPFTPTHQQAELFAALAEYLTAETAHHVFVLKGAAGTGKTTVLTALVRTMGLKKRRVELMAPTGRAAKVAAAKAGRAAHTIHHSIYMTSTSSDGRMQMRLRENKLPKDTLYVVDECSMLSDTKEGFGGRDSLLRDLLRYIWTHEKHARVLFIGDPAQLPPVGTLRSPALHEGYLRDRLRLTVSSYNLTAVKRQALESGILYNATRFRHALTQPDDPQWPHLALSADVKVLDSAQDAVEVFQAQFSPDDPEAVVMLTHSNSVAGQFNQAVRNELFHEPDLLTASDRILVVKNYYYSRDQRTEFVANGELGILKRVFWSTKTTYRDQEWVEANFEFQTGEGPEELLCTVPLGLLYDKRPSLPGEEMRTIFADRRAYHRAHSGRKWQQQFSEDPYVNALQIKPGYALTTHKAQGGQWRHVLIAFEPQLFQPREDGPDAQRNMRIEALRWTYTALTRASECLYVLNPPFPLERMTEALTDLPDAVIGD